MFCRLRAGNWQLSVSPVTQIAIIPANINGCISLHFKFLANFWDGLTPKQPRTQTQKHSNNNTGNQIAA